MVDDYRTVARQISALIKSGNAREVVALIAKQDHSEEGGGPLELTLIPFADWCLGVFDRLPVFDRLAFCLLVDKAIGISLFLHGNDKIAEHPFLTSFSYTINKHRSSQKMAESTQPSDQATTINPPPSPPKDIPKATISDGVLIDELHKLKHDLHAFAFALYGNRENAQDLMQQTILLAWGNKFKFEVDVNVKAFIFALMRNQFYRDVHSEQKIKSNTPNMAHDYVGDFRNDISSVLELREIIQMLSHLTEKQRQAILLCRVSELSIDETAEILDSTPSAVRKRITRGIRKLVKLLSDPQKENIAANSLLDRHIAVTRRKFNPEELYSAKDPLRQHRPAVRPQVRWECVN